MVRGKTFADVLAELNRGDLRVGIHVQSYSNEGSESCVSQSQAVSSQTLPEPSAAALDILALGCFGVFKKSKQQKELVKL